MSTSKFQTISQKRIKVTLTRIVTIINIVSHKITTNSSQPVIANTQKPTGETLDHSIHLTHSHSKLPKIEILSIIMVALHIDLKI